MQGRQLALIPGNEDDVGYWLTPEWFYRKLDAEFHFDFDPCPYPRPDGFNGLKENWSKSNWVNPPFVGHDSSRAAWVRKAIEEQEKGKSSVLIFPMDRWVTSL